MLNIATRDSDLALWQARHVQSLLAERLGVTATLRPLKTQGDLDLSTPLSVLEGKGFFTKELEDALLDGSADLAVHSLKDLPTRLPPGLVVAAVLSRADRRETLLIRKGYGAERQPLPLREGAILGTSSARRMAQVHLLSPDLELRDIRGNVPTRLRKLREGNYDAILLAWAGLSRLQLDLSDLDVVRLEPDVFLPAPGQGALALEIRSDDPATEAIVSQLDEPEMRRCVDAERGLLHLFAGGCKLPLGVYAQADERVRLCAVYAAYDPDGACTAFRTDISEESPSVAALRAFEDLLAQKSAWAQEHKPLTGKTVAVTRSAEHTDDLREAVERMGGRLLAVPTLAFEPAGDREEQAQRCDRLEEYDWIVFTSANAVHYFVTEMLRERRPEHARIGAVGEATADALREAGIKVHLVGPGTGGQFADAILERAGAGARVLWPTGEQHRDALPTRLEAAGVIIEPMIVYRTTTPPREARPAPEAVQPDWILVTSPAAGQNFVDMYGTPELARWAAIGPTTQAEMQKLLRIPVTVARETSLEALAEVLI